MNRPRNRQPRTGQQTAQGGANPSNSRGPKPRQHRAANYNPDVPTTSQVRPGALVSVVLKADQATGREVQGIVQEILTHGNHPRGIKVRLHDLRVGRVQRMVESNSSTLASARDGIKPQQTTTSDNLANTASGGRQDVKSWRAVGPVAQQLLQDDNGNAEPSTLPRDQIVFTSATVKCPMCDAFEGDEVAVSHHVQTHLD